ncbi:MAG: hypothetical protein ACRC1O_14600, partial [Ralstonia mannitolilytica]
MSRLLRLAHGTAGVAAVVAYQVGAHHAVATPGAHGLGLAMALVPPLAIALLAAARSVQRAWLVPLWLVLCGALWTMR